MKNLQPRDCMDAVYKVLKLRPKNRAKKQGRGPSGLISIECHHKGKPQALLMFRSRTIADRVIELILDRHPELAPVEQGEEPTCPSR